MKAIIALIAVGILCFMPCACAAGEIDDFFTAASKGDVEKVKTIISMKPELANTKWKLGQTALHSAAINGQKAVIEVLLAGGAYIEAEDSSLSLDSSRPGGVREEQGGDPARYRTKLVLELENDRMALITMALEKARKETGERERGALLEHIARVFLETAERGHGDSVSCNAVLSSAAPYRITIHHIPERKIAWIEGGSGPQYVAENTVQEAFCDAEVLDLGEAPVMGDPSYDRGACRGGTQGRISEERDKDGIECTPVTGHEQCCSSEKAATGGAGEDAERSTEKDPPWAPAATYHSAHAAKAGAGKRQKTVLRSWLRPEGVALPASY